MTRKEVIEGNKLIAEFMGYSVGFPHKTDKYGYIQTVEGYIIPSIVNPSPHPSDIDTHQFSLTDLRFHSSWDWLMLVVEKINTMNSKYEINIYSQVVTLFSYSPIETKAKFNNSEFTKIVAVWLTVIEFIKWYNSCKKE